MHKDPLTQTAGPSLGRLFLDAATHGAKLTSLRAGLAIALTVLLATPLARGQEPRTYTCPMHADIRRSAPGVCPRCGMALVATSLDRLEAYLLDVAVSPAKVPVGRPLTLRFAVRDPATRALVRELAVVHERPFHLFIVSEDLAWFEHVHPEQGSDGTFTLVQQLPRAGRYQLIADFVPEGAPPQQAQRALIAGDWTGPLRAARLPRIAVTEAKAGELTMTLFPDRMVATENTSLLLDVRERDGSEADLEPYLGAAVHVLAVSADLVDALHTHGRALAGHRGRLSLELCFPRAGVYRMWAQVQRRGVVHSAAFTVVVSPMSSAPPRP